MDDGRRREKEIKKLRETNAFFFSGINTLVAGGAAIENRSGRVDPAPSAQLFPFPFTGFQGPADLVGIFIVGLFFIG